MAPLSAPLHCALPLLLLLLLVARAAARDYLPCTVPTFGPSSNATVQLDNFGMNAVNLLVCNASTPSACVVGGPDVAPCSVLLPPNATSYVRVDATASALLVQYFVASSFNWHAIASTPPFPVPWPPGGGAGGDPVVSIPYPTPSSTLCDTAADCPAGVGCTAAPAPSRCATSAPSPAPPQPSPAAVPTPPSGPPAAACNVTGTWEQAHTQLHSGDAFINLTMLTGGGFTFSCVSKVSPGRCPYGLSVLNGTGVLSASDNSFTLSPNQPGTGPVTGVLNSTYACNVMTVLTPAPLGWTSQVRPPPAATNLDVTTATFLGQAQGEASNTQFVGTGVAVLAPGAPSLLVVAGNGGAGFGVTPTTLLSGSPTSNGTLVVLKVDTTSPPGSGATVSAVIKVGDRVDHVRANAAGQVVIAGSFGVALIKGLDAGSPTVVWHDALADVEPGTCGVCCSTAGASSNTTCRVDVGADGTVIADLAVTSASGALWAAWSAGGVRFAASAQPVASLDSVAVDAANHHLLVGYFYNSNTGKEPMVMPRVEYLTYDPKGTSPPVRDFENLPWDATTYRTPGQPCNGDVADGRVMGLRAANDGTLYFLGRSDGGDSPFLCGIRNSSRTTPLASIDGYTSPYDMSSQAITNFLKLDAAKGETLVGQQQLTRLPTTNKGNTLLTLAGQSDAGGTAYLLQAAACCLPGMENLTINGGALAGPMDATALLVLSPSLERRQHWTHFVAPGGLGGGGPVDIDVKGGAVALLMNAAGDMATVGPLPGTGPAGNPKVAGAYLVVFPALTPVGGGDAGARAEHA